MKYITITILGIMMLAACSTPEVVSEEPAEAESGMSLPEWYSPNKVSSSDSTHFSGYSMATAVDSLEAIHLGNESAIVNLRYEVDKFAEKVREGLAEEPYNTPQFIINLRNTIQQLSLSDSSFERGFAMRDDNVTQVYTRATLDRTEILERLSDMLSDQAYIRALQSDREEL